MQAEYTFTTFTPAEAERITRLNTVTQRDWRRRGFIPSGEGHARFDAFVICEMWVMKMLSDRGVGPQLSKDVADWCAIGIVWHALGNAEAYEGDYEDALEWRPKDLQDTWHGKANWLTKQILRSRGLRGVIPGQYFIWWADGSHVWHLSLDEAFSDVSGDERYAGPVIVLDLKALARTFLDRAGRSLVHVEFQRDDCGRLIE